MIVFFIGLKPDGNLSIYERTFNRCMGLTAHNNSLYLSSLFQIWRFENILSRGELYQDHDRCYVPQMSWITGDIDVHDLGVTSDNSLVFVNSLFSCIATTSDTYSFEPLWQPPFITKLAAEDRCHLNGMAMRDGAARYVTAISSSNAAEGWRERRHNGGIVMDISNDEILAKNLSMPHSPRWYRDTLWVLNSGSGEFGKIDISTGTFVPVCFCPGYARGLAFCGDFALIGLSKPRNKTFSGLALDDALKAHDVDARCAIIVVDLRTGDLVHSLKIGGLITELFDVVTLPGIQRPSAIGIVSDEIRRMISVPPQTER